MRILYTLANFSVKHVHMYCTVLHLCGLPHSPLMVYCHFFPFLFVLFFTLKSKNKQFYKKLPILSPKSIKSDYFIFCDKYVLVAAFCCGLNCLRVSEDAVYMQVHGCRTEKDHLTLFLFTFLS